MGLTVPTPQEDELASGYAGRIATANNLKSVDRAIARLREDADPSGKPSTMELLAAACNQSSEEFAAKHSLLAITRAATIFTGHEVEGPLTGGVNVRFGLLSPRAKAMACLDCANGDLSSKRPYSYWRRTHHLAGVDWCLKHQTPLVEMDASAYAHQPSMTIDQGDVSHHSAVYSELGHSVLQRLADIQCRWLESGRTVHARVLRNVLSKRCIELDFRVSQHGKREVISDRAQDLLPATWLQRHLPELLVKRRTEFLQKLDGASVDRHVAYPGFSYALALATVFDSTDEAFNRIAAEKSAQQMSSMAPNDAATQALQAFRLGSTLIEACKRHGAKQNDVEHLLRSELTSV